MKISIKHTLILAFVGLSIAIIGLMSKLLIQEVNTQRNSTQLSELAQLDARLFDALLDRQFGTSRQPGVTLVSDTGSGLKEITQLVSAIKQHMEAIAIAAKEQATGLSEINTSVNHMDQVTQQNAAMVEEMNAAGATLSEESGRLSELLAQFELNGAEKGKWAPARAGYNRAA